MANQVLVSIQAAVRFEHGCGEEGFDDHHLNTKFNNWCSDNGVDASSSNVIHDYDIDDELVTCPILGIDDKATLVELSKKEKV